MAEYVSMYRDGEPDIIVYHNKNERPAINLPHLHSQYEIFYNVSGAESFFFNNKFYSCEGHDLFVIPKTCVHKAIHVENVHYERCIISIDAKIISSINSAPYTAGSLSWMDYVGTSLPGKVNLKTDTEHNAFLKLIAEYNDDDDALYRHSVIAKILSFISKYFKEKGTDTSVKPRDIAEGALVIMEENFKTIKTSELSKQLFVNESYLSRIFKDKYGITISNYLLMRKIAEAKKYLYMGISVKEACLMSGFNNYSNFIRTFKNLEGISPGNFTVLSDPI